MQHKRNTFQTLISTWIHFYMTRLLNYLKNKTKFKTKSCFFGP